MWSSFLEPQLRLLTGPPKDLLWFAQELTHHSIHTRPDTVLWCDGAHAFNPYQMAEKNLEEGHQADFGADRVLIKRCMTAFQWDTVLTKHLDEKLQHTPTGMVQLYPFERLFIHPELQDWEQEDYVRFAVKHLKSLVRRHKVPINLFVDMKRWWQTHPILAEMTHTAATERWTIDRPDGRFRARCDDGRHIDPWLRRQVTLLDFQAEELEIQERLVSLPPRPRSLILAPPSR
jgi:hypothetical protein